MQMPGLVRLIVAAAAVVLGVRSATAEIPDAGSAGDSAPSISRIFETAGPHLGPEGRLVETEPLRAFYAQRHYQPVWIGAEGLSLEAQALLQVFREAGREGLDPADYVPALPAPGGVPGGVPVGVPGGVSARDAGTLAAADVALSAALARYVLDLRRGRAAPEKADRELRVTPKPLDLVRVLDDVAAAVHPGSYVRSLAPADPLYQGLRSALERYRRIVAAGGWPALADGPTLQPDTVDPRVPMLRLRLQIDGDHPPANGTGDPDRYDEALRQAVLRFQRRHGLAADGAVGARTRDAMNVPAESRVRQIAVNLERARWLPEDLGDPYVQVNMAAFALEVVEGGKLVLEMPVVVGRPARSTPMFSDEITYLEFNPYWHVPRTILREDKLPILRSNPALLAAQGIRVIGPGGELHDPTSIDWTAVSASNFPYTLRQDPGARNALGRIKFMFPNPYDIYLHDTPSRGLFQRTRRAYSSGCIRVEKPIELAEFLLRTNGDWPRARIERAIASGRNRAVTLATPVAVHLVYLTAWSDRSGRVQFRDDLYNRDARLVAALDSPRP